MTEGDRTRLVVVAGLDRGSTQVVSDRLMRAEPGAVVVHHDLRGLGEGVVRRRLWSAESASTEIIELAHGCVSCTLREDVLPLLRRLAGRPEVRRIVLHLDPVMEPEPVCWALANVVAGGGTVTELTEVEAVLAVVDEGTWLGDATGDEELADRDFSVIPDEERTLAQVAVAQVAFADAVVLAGSAREGWTAARVAAVLDRLVPAVPRTRIEGTEDLAFLSAIPASARRGTIDDAHAPLLRGEPPLEPDCGVALTLFTDRRPFHPQRLHEAFDVLLDGVVTTKGRIWLASQPDAVLWLEAAGGALRVGHAGTWLAAAHDDVWERAGAERRAKAALDWDPFFGDRTQELAILSHQASPEAITEALREALLTDDELAGGQESWRGYPDPFGSFHTDPCDDLELGNNNSTTDSRRGKA
ncbi:GTP-binding protein [Saccharomonospora sp. NPDC006951]